MRAIASVAAESGGATPLTPTIAKPWLLTRHAREWGLACFCFRREAFLCRARAGPLSREASPAIVESVQGCTAELVSPTLSNSKLDPPSCAGPALLFLLVQRACTDRSHMFVCRRLLPNPSLLKLVSSMVRNSREYR